MIRRPPRSTRTDTLFPYTTLFRSAQESAITRVQNHVMEHLEEPFTIERMAAIAAMSSRHFARMFVREVKMKPMEFLQGARIDRARLLLESTDLPLKTVAFRRSGERRVGKECVSTCRSRWSPYHSKKKTYNFHSDR